MLLIDRANNSAICVGMLCNIKQRQTQSGKSLVVFSIIKKGQPLKGCPVVKIK